MLTTDTGTTYGGLFTARVNSLGEIPPDSEMGDIILADQLPHNLTYSAIQFQKAQQVVGVL